MSIDSSKLKKGQILKVEVNKLNDRLPQKTLDVLQNNPYGKLVGYKMVDGNQFGLAIRLKDSTVVWFFENELSIVKE